MNVFLPADILIPDVESMEKWSVIAYDQFFSQPEYWKDVKETVGDAPDRKSTRLNSSHSV